MNLNSPSFWQIVGTPRVKNLKNLQPKHDLLHFKILENRTFLENISYCHVHFHFCVFKNNHSLFVGFHCFIPPKLFYQ